MKPHKHAELIKAWADGAEIEYLFGEYGWTSASRPTWDEENEYRIKHEPKPDAVMYTSAYAGEICHCDDKYKNGDNLKLIFDGETGVLKKVQIL